MPKTKVMNCKCEEFKGSTTIMCCNKCKLPLKNEPWSIPEQSVKANPLDALVIPRQMLFELIKSNNKLGQKEYKNNPHYNSEHFHHKIETKIIKYLQNNYPKEFKALLDELG